MFSTILTVVLINFLLSTELGSVTGGWCLLIYLNQNRSIFICIIQNRTIYVNSKREKNTPNVICRQQLQVAQQSVTCVRSFRCAVRQMDLPFCYSKREKQRQKSNKQMGQYIRKCGWCATCIRAYNAVSINFDLRQQKV